MKPQKLAPALLSASLTFAAISHSGAQIIHPESPTLSFEVASIKRNDLPIPMTGSFPGSGRFLRIVSTERNLVQAAYHVINRNMVIGGPPSMDKTVYRIEAEVSEEMFEKMQHMSADDRNKVTCLMIQSLLADRFKLRVHFAQKNLPVYALVVDSNVPKLPPANDPSVTEGGWAMSPQGEMVIRNMELDRLFSSRIFGFDDMPVLNETGFNGKYNLKLKFRREVPLSSYARTGSTLQEDGLPSINQALREQLGLRMTRTYRDMEVVYVDSISDPTDN